MTFDDPVVDALALQQPLPPIESTNNVFHDLMSCLVEQQIHYRSTKRRFARLLERAGLDDLTPATYPQFEQEGLSSVKLSAQKVRAIAHTVDFFDAHTPDWAHLADDEVRAVLGEIPGIGPWTVDMILLYTLQRPDVFPAGDYHLKRIMTARYKLTAPRLKAQMEAIAENWRPNRSLAVRLLLGAEKRS
ncbi:MAG: hypothetical protein AAGI08_19065 [Bacteroidota bacterium]